MTQESDDLPIGSTKTDIAVSAAKGIAGMIPLAGSIISEVVGHVIPNQRLDRLEVFVKALHDRLEELGQPLDAAKFDHSTKIDLFEDGAQQSSRALSKDRIDYISRVVAFGLTGEEKERIQAKRLLNLIEELDDDQIIILSSYLRKNRDDRAFQGKHAAVLRPIPVHLGSDHAEMDEDTLYKLARAQLRNLGLIAPRYSKPKKGELPEFDEKTGMMKASYTDLTSLGRLLLQRIGLAGVRDY